MFVEQILLRRKIYGDRGKFGPDESALYGTFSPGLVSSSGGGIQAKLGTLWYCTIVKAKRPLPASVAHGKT